MAAKLSSLFEGLPVPLLHTGFGNLEAAMDSTKPCKSSLGQVWPVEVIRYLQTRLYMFITFSRRNEEGVNGEI